MKEKYSYETSESDSSRCDIFEIGGGIIARYVPFELVEKITYFLNSNEMKNDTILNVKKTTSCMAGWICPVCGAGLSPFTTKCPCNMPTFKVTC
jgi:hypothetical protein